MLAGYPHQFIQVNGSVDVTRFGRLRLKESLVERLRRQSVKALWIQGWQVAAYWQAVWQAQSADVPVWIRAESHDLKPRRQLRSVARILLLRELFKRIDYFLYIGQANRRLYESFGVNDGRLRHAPYCVDNERFARQAEALRSSKDEIRRKFRIPKNAFCIVFVGKFIRAKRPLDVVRAAKRFAQRNGDRPVHLLWVGSGELGQQLRSSCRVVFDAEDSTSAGLPNGTESLPAASFAGFLNQMEIARAYAAADCLVLPSESETWGLVINEAMASGVPCLVSRACGSAEDLVAPIHSDFVSPVGDEESICRGLEKLAKIDAGALPLAERVQMFDVSRCVETVKDVYLS
jgi:glycosyltransferase involved in cell wall biosynthesis